MYSGKVMQCRYNRYSTKGVISVRRGRYYIPNIGALKGKDGKKILEIIKNTTPPNRSDLEKEVRECEQEIMVLRKNGK